MSQQAQPREWTAEELYEIAWRLLTRMERISKTVAKSEKYHDVVQDMVFAAYRQTQREPKGRGVVEQTMRTAFTRHVEKKNNTGHRETTLEKGAPVATDDKRLEEVEVREAAKTQLAEALDKVNATPLQRKVAAALIQFDMDRDQAAVSLNVRRATVDSVLQNLRNKVKQLEESEPRLSKPGVPEGTRSSGEASSVRQDQEGQAEGVLRGVRSESAEDSRASRPGSGERPGAQAATDAVSDLPQDSGSDSSTKSGTTGARAPAATVGPRSSEAPARFGKQAGARKMTSLQLMTYFVHRKRPFAVMHEAEGRVFYTPVDREITIGDLDAHLAGDQTLGVYSTAEDNTVSWVCWDIDERNIDHVVNLTLGLDGPYLIEDSGNKGFHVWQFFEEPVDAAQARRYGLEVATAAGLPDIEVFPKQDDVKGGLGNLVKLPGGVHLKTGNRAEVKQGTLGVIKCPVSAGDAHGAKAEAPTGPERVTKREVDGWIAELFNGGLEEGGRNNSLNRFIAWLVSRDIPMDVVETTIRYVNEHYCSPPLDEDELSILLRPRRFAA